VILVTGAVSPVTSAVSPATIVTTPATVFCEFEGEMWERGTIVGRLGKEVDGWLLNACENSA